MTKYLLFLSFFQIKWMNKKPSCFRAYYMSGTARQHVRSFIYRLPIETNVSNMQHRVTHDKTDKIIVTLIHERNKTSSRTKNNYFMEEVDI